MAGLAVVGDVEGFLSGRERGLDVSRGQGDGRACVEAPRQRLRMPAGRAGGLDGAVEQLNGLCEPALSAPDHPEDCVDEREELALAGGTADRQRPFGVSASLAEAVEVELCARQMHRCVQTPRELVVAE